MLNRFISAVMSVCIMISSLFTGLFSVDEKLRIVVPEDWELCVGDSRTLECVFSEKITERELEWSVKPERVASVDKWGRVTAKQVGKATVTAKGNSFSDSVELNVVETPTLIENCETKTIRYQNEALMKFQIFRSLFQGIRTVAQIFPGLLHPQQITKIIRQL